MVKNIFSIGYHHNMFIIEIIVNTDIAASYGLCQKRPLLCGYWRRRRRLYDLYHCNTDRRRDNVSTDFCPLTTLRVNQRLFNSLEKRK